MILNAFSMFLDKFSKCKQHSIMSQNALIMFSMLWQLFTTLGRTVMKNAFIIISSTQWCVIWITNHWSTVVFTLLWHVQNNVTLCMAIYTIFTLKIIITFFFSVVLQVIMWCLVELWGLRSLEEVKVLEYFFTECFTWMCMMSTVHLRPAIDDQCFHELSKLFFEQQKHSKHYSVAGVGHELSLVF